MRPHLLTCELCESHGGLKFIRICLNRSMHLSVSFQYSLIPLHRTVRLRLPHLPHRSVFYFIFESISMHGSIDSVDVELNPSTLPFLTYSLVHSSFECRFFSAHFFVHSYVSFHFNHPSAFPQIDSIYATTHIFYDPCFHACIYSFVYCFINRCADTLIHLSTHSFSFHPSLHTSVLSSVYSIFQF